MKRWRLPSISKPLRSNQLAPPSRHLMQLQKNRRNRTGDATDEGAVSEGDETAAAAVAIATGVTTVVTAHPRLRSPICCVRAKKFLFRSLRSRLLGKAPGSRRISQCPVGF